MRKRRLRKVNWFAQGCSASEWLSLELVSLEWGAHILHEVEWGAHGDGGDKSRQYGENQKERHGSVAPRSKAHYSSQEVPGGSSEEGRERKGLPALWARPNTSWRPRPEARTPIIRATVSNSRALWGLWIRKLENQSQADLTLKIYHLNYNHVLDSSMP